MILVLVRSVRKLSAIADENGGSYFRLSSENNSKGSLPISKVEWPSHLTTYEIVSMDELTILPPVKWIFKVPNVESLPCLISHQPPLNTDKEESKPADAIQLTVDICHSNQNNDCISLEKDGGTKRENEEVESGSSRFEEEGAEGRKYDENGFFYSLMVQNGWTMPKIINQDKELRFNSKDTKQQQTAKATRKYTNKNHI